MSQLTCEVCGERKGGLRCSACQRGSYCSRECQKRDWASHRLICKGGTAFSAELGDSLACRTALRLLREVSEIYAPIQYVHAAADRVRIAAYRRAVSAAIHKLARSSVHVVHVNSGTGLLPLLTLLDAVQAHQRVSLSVVEQFRSVSVLVSAVTQHKVNVVHSPGFAPGDKLAPADVVVCETPTLQLDGIRLSPGAVIVPEQVKVFAVLVELECSSAGFDLSAFQQFGWSPVLHPVNAFMLRHRVLTEPFVVDDSVAVAATVSGRLDGILVWTELRFSETDTLDTRTLPSMSSYFQQFFAPRSTKVGDMVRVFTHRCADGKLLVSLLEPSPQKPEELPSLKVFPATPLPSVLSWHFPMLADERRSGAYFRALQVVIGKCETPPLVLDVGSGTGLLAMLAAKAGAGSVVGCEAVPFIAACAQQCIAQNGPHLCPITIISSMSTELVPGKTSGLPRLADIVIQEIMDAAVLGEGVIPSMDHAMQHLAKPHARAIPASARVFAALIDTSIDETFDSHQVKYQIDLRQITSLNNGRFEEEDIVERHWPLVTEPVMLFEFDFCLGGKCRMSRTRQLTTKVTRPGMATAVAIWFELDMDGTGSIVLSSSPITRGTSAWGQAVTWLAQPVVCSSSIVHLIATHSDLAINVTVAEEPPGIQLASQPPALPNSAEMRALEQCILTTDKDRAIHILKASLPNSWSRLGYIVEHAAELGIDQQMAADFALELCH